MTILLEEEDMSSVMNYSRSGPNQEMNDQGSVLPGYVPCGAWLLAVVPTAYSIVNVDSLAKVPEYDACLIEESEVTEMIWILYYQ